MLSLAACYTRYTNSDCCYHMNARNYCVHDVLLSERETKIDIYIYIENDREIDIDK